MKSNKNMARFLDTLDELDKNGKSIPGLVMSNPGAGKSSMLKKWCEYKDYDLFVVIPSQFSSDDLLGIQSVVDGKLKRLTPAWFDNMVDTINKNHKRSILFIDELSATDPYLQAPLLNLIFNHDLGEAKLPENVMIVAAGNYSSNLNNAFKLSAPLVNRFMILNLENNEFDLGEVLDETFTTVETSKDIEKFFGMKKETPKYDFFKFKEWIRSSNEVAFGSAEYTEDETYGLLGFTSVRSLSYSLAFMQTYVDKYSDKLWMKVVGDTLGLSPKREGKMMRSIIERAEDLFVRNKRNGGDRTIEEYSSIFTSGKYTTEDIEDFKDFIRKLKVSTLTKTQTSTIARIFISCSDNIEMTKTLEIFNDKITDVNQKKLEG